MKHKNLSSIFNQRGAVVLSTLVVISLMVVIMIGIASVEARQIAKDSARVNEAHRYLNVMEEMAQVVGRARILGMETQTAGVVCPDDTVRVPAAGTPYLCLPDPDNLNNATVTGIRTVCLEHTDFMGLTEEFCLNNVSIITGVAAPSGTFENPPSAAPGTAGVEGLSSATWDTNYHNNENWFPLPAWSNTTEILTPTCTVGPDARRGCVHCGAPGVSCVQFQVCHPKDGPGCSNPYVQRIAVY